MDAPARYVEWINANLGFNPRSQRNSDALSDFVLDDLRGMCSVLDSQLRAGDVKAKKNLEVYTRVANRNVDLVIFKGSSNPAISVLASVENKTIMTAHGKARKNRYGDLIAYANHVHNHRRDCVAGGLLVVNISPAYENPDGFAKGLTRNRFNMEKVVADTIHIFEQIPLRNDPAEPSDQPEALGVVLIDYDGVRPARLVHEPPAPQPDSSVCYDNFVSRVSDIYAKRFG